MDAIQYALDFEKSRREEVEHLPMTSSHQDTNLELICHQAMIRDLNLDPRLQVEVCPPQFDPKGSTVFRPVGRPPRRRPNLNGKKSLSWAPDLARGLSHP